MEKKNLILKVKNLNKVFNLYLLDNKKIFALNNISFEIERFKFYGISGKSGCGKSSLLKCIYGTYKPTSGDIFFFGKDGFNINLAKCKDEEIINIRKEKISYVSQFLQIIPRVKCIDIVSQMCRKSISDDEKKKKAKELLKKLLLPENLFDAFPTTFSGGEKQKVNIAKALINDSELLLLDEPTASLDINSKKAVFDIIMKLKEKGMTVVGIFHDKRELERFSDVIIYMEGGKILDIYENKNKKCKYCYAR